ncbi:16S rRNA (guanine(966)-N(2))-methyltransferase RsmD [Actimicrobium antarcticum]|uniref:16S rRNA (Guanine(966)-N(2))-methyltransferase RsmD n=1 Tax=Actimicrobium antarcticum TaxID=1051899 RepID=A0ABP7T8X9_9BURK
MPKKPTQKPAPKPRQRPVLAHQVRIIGGDWKRTPLPVLDSAGLRPTPDRVRETVFNWLTHLLDGQWTGVACLDLFAGTGALGFEAASRGAARVLLVEENQAVVRQLEASRDKLHAGQITILRGDARTMAQGLQRRLTGPADLFQVIFLDPPFHAELLPAMLPLCADLLADGGLVYLEAGQALDNENLPEWLNGWQVVRADHAGMVFFHLLQRQNRPEIEA